MTRRKAPGDGRRRSSGGSTAAAGTVDQVECNVCGLQVPLTPVAKQVKKHAAPSSGSTCAGSGHRPLERLTSAPTSGATGWPRWAKRFKRWSLIAGAASALATTLGVATDLGFDLDFLGGSDGTAVRAMTGTYNIAVADFAATGDDKDDRDEIVSEGQSLAGGIAAELEQTICAERPGGYDVECRGPRDLPLVAGDDTAERAERAADVASDLEADVLVYGTVSRQRGQVTAQPAVYIAERRLPQLEELAGPHELASSGGYIGTGQERRNAVDALQKRVTNLANVMFTLDKYNLGEADEAQAFLDELSADEDWEFDRHILELITGNVWGKLGNWDMAIQHYDASLRLYGEATSEVYSRATVGKAEARHHQLRVGAGEEADCAPNDPSMTVTLVSGLEEVLDQYATGRAAAEAENADVITRKADYGTGRVEACLARAGAGDEYWARTERTFTALIDTLDAVGESDTGLTPAEEQMLAESHSFLGFVSWQRTDTLVTRERLRAALAEYRMAAQVTHLDSRRHDYLEYASQIEETLDARR